MRAIHVVNRFGGSEVLEVVDLPVPAPRADQVLIGELTLN